MDYNNDFKYDLALGQLGEGWLGHLLSSKTIEVKFDFGCYRTGNFYIEYESRGKKSGIATTEATHWAFIIEDIESIIIIETERLKRLAREYYHNSVKGGDNNTSKMVLIPIVNLWKKN